MTKQNVFHFKSHSLVQSVYLYFRICLCISVFISMSKRFIYATCALFYCNIEPAYFKRPYFGCMTTAFNCSTFAFNCFPELLLHETAIKRKYIYLYLNEFGLQSLLKVSCTGFIQQRHCRATFCYIVYRTCKHIYAKSAEET